jgi:hypothetical protein
MVWNTRDLCSPTPNHSLYLTFQLPTWQSKVSCYPMCIDSWLAQPGSTPRLDPTKWIEIRSLPTLSSSLSQVQTSSFQFSSHVSDASMQPADANVPLSPARGRGGSKRIHSSSGEKVRRAG